MTRLHTQPAWSLAAARLSDSTKHPGLGFNRAYVLLLFAFMLWQRQRRRSASAGGRGGGGEKAALVLLAKDRRLLSEVDLKDVVTNSRSKEEVFLNLCRFKAPRF